IGSLSPSFPSDNSYLMITNDLGELRGLIRRVLRGLRAHHGPLHRRGGRRHAGLVAYLASEGPSTVSELAEALGVSLPAASTVTAALDDGERAAFLKGLRALADALMEESEHGPLRPHHRHAHRRRPHRD